MKQYEVGRIEKNQLKISGKGEDRLWEKAKVLNDFCSPWDAEKPAEIQFRTLWDGVHLFFCFTVFDSEIHIEKTDDSVDSIGNSDRVELFFRPDASLNPYYCMEIDTEARIMDFIALPNKNFDFDWKWPEHDLVVQSSRDDKSFTVEGQISIESLQRFNLIKENTIETGIFRAKYVEKDHLNFEPTWISWVNPNTETPNFHTPSSFGELILMD
jgi:hypothetical protein